MVLGDAPVFEILDDIYTADQNERYIKIQEKFIEKFGVKPLFFARAPGRVNLIGEHVDYSGYSVLPMAIENDAAIAISISSSPSPGSVVDIVNLSDKFKSLELEITLPHLIDDNSIFKNHHWTNYFFAATQGLVKYKENEIDVASALSELVKRGKIQIVVDGTVPIGSGLSSSSSMVCGYSLAISHLLFTQGLINQPLGTMNQLASLAAKSERFIGIESGGMDQAISFLAERNFAMRIDFNPSLKATPVQLPTSSSFILCNSLVEHSLQSAASGTGYNVRVVECRLAAALLVRILKLNPQKPVKTLFEFECIYRAGGAPLTNTEAIDSLSACLQVVENNLHSEPYSLNEILTYFPELSESEFQQQYLGCVTDPEILNSLKLRSRAYHVFSEAKRVIEFQEYCNVFASKEEITINDISTLGRLMDDSHGSCKDNFECSCKELDEIVNFARNSGALGARLTGAGWGGWCIIMVPTSSVDSFLIKLASEYYSGKSALPASSLMFRTTPAAGACIFSGFKN